MAKRRGLEFNVRFGRRQPTRPRRPAGPRAQRQGGPDVVVVQQRGVFRRGQTVVQQVPTVPFQDWAEKVKPPGGSVLWRNRMQLAPWAIPAALLVVSGVLQAVAWLGVDRTHLAWGVAVAALAVGAVAAKVAAGRLQPRWRPRVYAWAVAGSVWLTVTAARGLSWFMVAVLVIITDAITSGWWQHFRPGYPTQRPATPRAEEKPEPRPDRTDTIANFQANVAKNPGGPVPGSRLENRRVKDGIESYDWQLVPGKQSLRDVLAVYSKVVSGLRRRAKNVLIEEHPTGDDDSVIRLRIVPHSPVETGVPFTAPQWHEDGADAWIEVGTYADGDGRVTIPVLAKNSAYHCIMFGGQGAGKTNVLNLIALAMLASGKAVVWYLDGQDGASSPQLLKYADWAPTGPDAAMQMLVALEAFCDRRGKILKARRVPGLDASRDLPALFVVIDECHEVFLPSQPKIVGRWDKVMRKMRKLAAGAVVSTQHPEMASLGNKDSLRSVLQQRRTLVFRTASAVAAGILRIRVDPSQLPDEPGYAYLIAPPGAARSAMWRAEYLDSDHPGEGGLTPADAWFERLLDGAAALDEQTARGLPEFYRKRREYAEAERRRMLAELDGSGRVDEQQGEVGGAASLRLVQGESTEPPAWPTWPPAAEPVAAPGRSTPAGLEGRLVEVWAEVAAGRGSAAAIADVLRLSSSRVYELLGQLERAGHVRKTPVRGRYETTSG